MPTCFTDCALTLDLACFQGCAGDLPPEEGMKASALGFLCVVQACFESGVQRRHPPGPAVPGLHRPRPALGVVQGLRGAGRRLPVMRRRALSGAPRSPRFSAVSGSEAITNGIRIRVVLAAPPGPRVLRTARSAVVLHLYRADLERGLRHRPAGQPPLADHRRQRPHRRGPRPRVVGAQPVLAPGDSSSTPPAVRCAPPSAP